MKSSWYGGHKNNEVLLIHRVNTLSTFHQKLVGRVGFEPTTNGLKGRCSTTELPSRYVEHSIRFSLSVNDFFKKP